MAGYKGWKMSINAENAYREGKMPISKWTKPVLLQRADELGMLRDEMSKDRLSKLSLVTLRDVLLIRTEWHHTGKYYRKTPFYKIDRTALEGYVTASLM